MAPSSGKKGPARGKVEVTYFQKPPDRTKTVLETPIVSVGPRDTVREMPVPAVAAKVSVTTAPPKKRSSRERRHSTELELEIPEHARGGTPDAHGIVRHGAKTLGHKQIAEMALFGHSLFESGRTKEAKAVFEGLVELGVEDAFPHTMLGILFLSEGAQDRALALFEAALALDPKDLAARVYRAELQLGRGKAKSAVRELEAVLAETPSGNPFGERARKLLSEAGEGGAERRKRR